ncbi:SpoIIE family protein phosphatase [Paucibacter sp. R3-3]|uniref:SpoIIE family protein phosphatase n=1 Tax=Roseateles agri TaxID=3098619 RepID=A0ABU5DDM5_9BURK|nr:SpoIIE family protein phosphatase [Paucibacter sp. R3-3]MDY0743911.1 SpoIIE family protein phosphatase [Paucibacter sp. R3-3]
MSFAQTLAPPRARFAQPVAGDLAAACVAATPEHTNAQVYEILGRHRDMVSLPVVEDGRPIGLINRSLFLSQISKPFYKELFEKKSCIAFMDKEPLIVDAATTIEQLALLTVESGEKALADGFLVVEDGKLKGLGYGLELMRVIAEQQAERNRHIMQSIEYASVLQRSMLSVSADALSNRLGDACLVWEPRDTVGGDFYQFVDFPDGWFAAVADCTGHGVPGAFLTLIAFSALKQALDKLGPQDPAALMVEVSLAIKSALAQQDGVTTASNDGLDAAFLWFDATTQTLSYAGARTPLLLLEPGQAGVEIVDADRLGMGYADTPSDARWTSKKIALKPGSLLMTCTDGLIDQIGGPKSIAFGKRRLRDALVRHRELPMPRLGAALMAELADYQGGQFRRDDLTLFGFRLPS